jgi:hypothetical protein
MVLDSQTQTISLILQDQRGTQVFLARNSGQRPAASGATLTPQYTDDLLANGQTHWTNTTAEASGTFLSALTADGAVRMESASHAAVRLLVTTVGTGNITVQATASSVASNKVFTLPTPLAYVAQSSLLLTNIVATTSTQLTNPGAAQKTLTICTLPASPANVWLNPAGGSAVVNQGLPVWSGGGCTPINPPPTGVLYGISDGTSSVSITASGG